jgi:prepilin-type N-terminal cleavage/methylation domain-containing protein
MTLRARVRAREAFTLIEVLVAVAVLSLTATASLKLAALAEKTLASVREKDRALQEMLEIETEVRIGSAESFGTSGDLRWESKEKIYEGFDEDFGKLNFSGDRSLKITIPWRELTIEKKGLGKTVFVLPPSGERVRGGSAGDRAASADESKR